jgi:hypothetical protein
MRTEGLGRACLAPVSDTTAEEVISVLFRVSYLELSGCFFDRLVQ